MSFKQGDHVVITAVPPRAVIVGVTVGMKAIVLPPRDILDGEGAPNAELVRIQIGTLHLWWHVLDMRLDPGPSETQQVRQQNLKLRLLLADVWPYVHQHCTIQTLRDQVLAAMRDRP